MAIINGNEISFPVQITLMESTQDNGIYYASKLASLFEFSEFPENYNLTLKLQKAVSIASVVRGSNVKSVKLISVDKESTFEANHSFRECSLLETIDLTDYSRKPSTFDYAIFNSNTLKRILGVLDLSQCTSCNYGFHSTSLEEVEFVPNTIRINIRFPSPNLTDASIESIINGLADLTGGTAQTLTLNGVGTKLTETQRARISAKNWTLAY
jgi:hypothetical protein